MTWCLAKFGNLLDVRLFLFGASVTNTYRFLQTSSKGSAKVQFFKKPVRWNAATILRQVLPLGVVITQGSMLLAMVILGPRLVTVSMPSQTAADSQSVKRCDSQAMSLHMLILYDLMPLLCRSEGRFWAHEQDWRILMHITCGQVVLTVACITGWMPEGFSLSMTAAVWAWVITFVTFGAAAAARYTTYGGELTEEM